MQNHDLEVDGWYYNQYIAHRVIMFAEFQEEQDRLRLILSSGKEIFIHDDMQTCCESRFMKMDDNPVDFVGASILNIELVHVKNDDDPDRDWETHEVAFLKIETDRGTMTVNTHNVHNGYYGGFNLAIGEL